MPPENNDAVALGIVVEQLKYLREDVQRLTAKLDKSNEDKVSHREWAQRNEHVNNRFSHQGREIGELRTEINVRVNEIRTELRAKSAPWWSVCAVAVAAISLLWSIISPAIIK